MRQRTTIMHEDLQVLLRKSLTIQTIIGTGTSVVVIDQHAISPGGIFVKF